MFFFVCWKYCKVPLHLQLLVKWEVVSPNSRYREFYHEIGNIEKFPFTYWLNGRWFLQIVDIHVGNFNMKLTGRWFPQTVDRDSGNLYPIYIITKIVVLVSEPVRGRSRATELPCLTYWRHDTLFDVMAHLLTSWWYFWHNDALLTSGHMFDVMTKFAWCISDIMMKLLHHVELFGVMMYDLIACIRVSVVFPFRGLFTQGTPFGLSFYQYPLIINRIWLYINGIGVFDDSESIGDTLKETGSEYYWLPVTVKVCGTCWVADKLLWALTCCGSYPGP